MNPTLDEHSRPLDFSTFGDNGGDVSVWTLADRSRAGEPDVTNSYGNPTRVAPVESTIKTPGPKFDYKFPALSLTVIKRLAPQANSFR